MKNFVTYLGCGSLDKTSREVVNFNVRKLSDINTIVIPFLLKHPILGEKLKDFQDWCKVLYFFESGTHMKNIDEIVNIKSQMNNNRIIFN